MVYLDVLELMNIISVLFCRYSFPFGRPEGALKATIALFERVSLVIFYFFNCISMLEFSYSLTQFLKD